MTRQITLTPESAAIVRLLATETYVPASRIDSAALGRILRGTPPLVMMTAQAGNVGTNANAHYTLTASGHRVAAVLPTPLPRHPFTVEIQA